MNKIAIRGSEIGTDVIKYLESLGGINEDYTGNNQVQYYYKNNLGIIKLNYREHIPSDYTFLEKVPTKTINNYELWEK